MEESIKNKQQQVAFCYIDLRIYCDKYVYYNLILRDEHLSTCFPVYLEVGGVGWGSLKLKPYGIHENNVTILGSCLICGRYL